MEPSGAAVDRDLRHREDLALESDLARVRRRPATPRIGTQASRAFVWVVLALAFTIGVAAVVVELNYFPPGPSGGPPPVPPFPVVNATVRVNTSEVVRAFGPGSLGVNVRADQSLSESVLADVESTPVRYARWPGGGISDRFDPLANGGAGVYYLDNGDAVTATTSVAQFVSGCRALDCAAIITLPAEIDNPSYAAEIVSYIEGPLAFHPAYWEIGNEPRTWYHFGIPWSRWSVFDNSTVTPSEYGVLVHAYIQAIRAVDTTTPIIGLGGVGVPNSVTDTDVDAPWIAATLSANGPNVSAIATHIYPAVGAGPNETAAEFLASLTGPNGLPNRISQDEAAIRASCPARCDVQLLVDEYGSTSSNELGALLASYTLVPYVATELIQGLESNVSSLDYFDLESSSTPTAWVEANGTVDPVYRVFSDFASALPAHVLASSVDAPAAGLSVLAGSSGNASSGAVLFGSNANATVGFRTNLTQDGFPTQGPVEVWSWDAPSPTPTFERWTSNFPAAQTLPPGGLLLALAPGNFSTGDSTAAVGGLARSTLPIHHAPRPGAAGGPAPPREDSQSVSPPGTVLGIARGRACAEDVIWSIPPRTGMGGSSAGRGLALDGANEAFRGPAPGPTGPGAG